MKHGKLLIVGGAVAIVAVVAGGWLLGAQPLLSAASASERELESTAQFNELQEIRLADLESGETRLDELRDRYEDLEIAIPTDGGTADLLGQLALLEEQTGARVTTLSLVPATSAPDTADTDSTVETSAETSADTPTETPAETPAATAAEAAGLSSQGITLGVEGASSAVRAFLAALQSDEVRLMTVSTLGSTTEPSTGTVQLEIAGFVYTLPAAP